MKIKNYIKPLKIVQIICAALFAMMSIQLFYDATMLLLAASDSLGINHLIGISLKYVDFAAASEIIVAILLLTMAILQAIKLSNNNIKLKKILGNIGVWCSFASTVLLLLLFILSYMCLPRHESESIIKNLTISTSLQPTLIKVLFLTILYCSVSTVLLFSEEKAPCLDEEILVKSNAFNDEDSTKNLQSCVAVGLSIEEDVAKAINPVEVRSNIQDNHTIQERNKNNLIKALLIIFVAMTIVFTVTFPCAYVAMPSEPAYDVAFQDKIVFGNDMVSGVIYVNSELQKTIEITAYFNVDGEEKTDSQIIALDYPTEFHSFLLSYSADENVKVKIKSIEVKIDGIETKVPYYTTKVKEFTAAGVITLLLFVASLIGTITLGSIYLIDVMKRNN